jgi:4-alpha-glucanotransferase
VQLPRSSGILLHPTSLPGGRLGRDAFAFVDWLAAAGQSWWQMLPLGPPDEFNSPYRSPSAFAASPELLASPRARVTRAEVDDFVERHPFWIGGWTRFAGDGAIEDQVRFEREWSELRAYAHDRGVRLIGDVPIYVSDEGADVEAWPELFAHGEVAGAPPDRLSATGQLWGNPLYDWPVHRETGYRWWIERFRRTFQLVDVARVDHFRGYLSYWAVPDRNTTARAGRWRPGPRAGLFRAVERELGGLPLIAEDLGVITPPVHRLAAELGLPGMVVLHWAFSGRAGSPHRKENHRADQVVYTSTHDTDTALGWFASLTRRRQRATELDPADPAWSLIEVALASKGSLAVILMQDVLRLGSEARMNRPGVPRGNWTWRLAPGALTRDIAAELREATARNGRI